MTTSKSSFKKSSNKSNKRVSFASDTNFEPGRTSAEYSRSSICYNPGLHAASKDHMLEDTSFFFNVHFNCTQLKVYTSTHQEVNSLVASCKAPSQNEGIASHHPRKDEIIETLEDQDEDNGTLEECLKNANWLLLEVDDDELVMVFLHQALES
jgi:hypothetical protein